MKTAFYMRLSVSDGDLGKDGKDESNSIENQRFLLCDFLRKRSDISEEVVEYIDDGYSGANFERPAFQKMLKDAQASVISTIIVKDLSRFGRDYITAGDYIEQIFPVIGVRFIAVNNNFDTINYPNGGYDLDFAVTNLINAFYCRDVSKKITSTLKTCWKQGRVTATSIPFGYKIERNGKELKWAIDTEAAEVVRMIFDCALKGWTTSTIARHLNELEIPTPGVYNQKNHHLYLRAFITPESERLWEPYTVWSILRREEYTGTLIMGKHRKVTSNSERRVTTPKEERVIIPNNHPAIVTEKVFKMAQAVIMVTKKKTMCEPNEYALKGKIRCGNCRLSMYYNNRSDPETFYCSHKRKAGRRSQCSTDSVPKYLIEAKVWLALQNLFMIFRKDDENIKRSKRESRREMIDSKEKQLSILNEEQFRKYEAYADGTIPREVYIETKNKLNYEICLLRDEISELKRQEEESSDMEKETDTILADADEFEKARRLTKEIVDKYIDVVYVYDAEHIEVKIKATAVMDRVIDKFFANIGGSTQQPATF